MMKQGFWMVFSILLIGLGSAQVEALWSAEDHGGIEGVWAEGPILLRMDAEGNVYGAGLARYRDDDFLLVKYAPDGTRLWSQFYDGESAHLILHASEYLAGFTLDPQGNALPSGSTNPIQNQQTWTEGIVLKYSPEGVLDWNRTQPSSDGARVAVDVVGNIIAVTQNIDRCYVWKYTPEGTLLWETNFQPRTTRFIQTDPQGFIWLSGGDYEVRVRKLASDGTWLWDWHAPWSGWDLASGLLLDSQGNAYVSAMYARNPDGSLGSYDLAIWKLNPEGQVDWSARHEAPYNEHEFGWVDNQGIALDEGAAAIYAVVNVGGGCIGCQPLERLLFKYRASDGQLGWMVPVQMPEGVIQRVMAVAVDEKGRIYVLGYTARELNYDADIGYIERGIRFMVTRFDSAGRQHGMYQHSNGFYPMSTLLVDGSTVVVGGVKTYEGMHIVKMRAVAVRSEGDVNEDGCIDDNDLAQVIFSFGTGSRRSDVNEDGIVDDVD